MVSAIQKLQGQICDAQCATSSAIQDTIVHRHPSAYRHSSKAVRSRLTWDDSWQGDFVVLTQDGSWQGDFVVLTQDGSWQGDFVVLTQDGSWQGDFVVLTQDDSWQGDFVVLASEPVCICGVDVAAPQQLRTRNSQHKMSMAELRSIFSRQFTDYEVREGCIAKPPVPQEGACCHVLLSEGLRLPLSCRHRLHNTACRLLEV